MKRFPFLGLAAVLFATGSAFITKDNAAPKITLYRQLTASSCPSQTICAQAVTATPCGFVTYSSSAAGICADQVATWKQ